ncbi:MAG: SRPBCC domain-containing protein, partial [Steroidobacteraceae bacterium]
SALVVRRTIAASPEEIFDAWLDPAALGIWMRPNGIRHTSAKVDARVGGGYEINMQGDENTYAHSGVYRVIDRPRRLVFTWVSQGTERCETLVTVEFLQRDQRTEVVVTHEQLPAGARESHSKGWTSGLERLAEFSSSGALS